MKYTNKKAFEKGYNEMIAAVSHPEMMGMEFGVVAMSAGDQMHFSYAQEVVYTLLSGEVGLAWDGESARVERPDCFHHGATLLHVPADTAVSISCFSGQAEIAVSRTENKKRFAARLLTPDTCLCSNEMRGDGQMNGCSTRLVRSFFDRSKCPETNFYIGEVVSLPGKWSSYPPHHHVEAELYYYKFLPENGYALAEYGDEAYKIRHNDLMGMPKNISHSQVTAPGYAEYYLWCIRLQDEVALETLFDPEHLWVTEEGARYFPEI